ncbi:MAG TPA: CHAT domain-containing tetratricopeptide repeat protein [Blastocatellia bacterium]|nr:CHAT domain-containing tetratricopeptide repeat protein [Blastocatellia bacterium]
MAHGTEPRSITERRGLTLFLLAGLIVVTSWRQVFPESHGLNPPAVRQHRDEGRDVQAGEKVRLLEPGKPIQRELMSGMRHPYRIQLAAGQFLKAIVTQQGIDLIVRVTGPDGKQILELNAESRLQGQEPVSLVAETAGDYQLVIRPTLKESPAGSYEIRIEALRVATEQDRIRQDAYNLRAANLKLRRAGQYDEALPLAERALEIWEQLLGPEDLEVAAALCDLADSHYDKGEYARAEPLFKRALAIREKSLGPDHPGLAASLNSLASTYRVQGKYREAEPLCKSALAIYERALGPDHPSVAGPLGDLGELYQLRGKYSEAEPLFKRALTISEKALGPDQPEVAVALNNLAVLYQDQARSAEAEPLLKRSLAIRERAFGPDHQSVAIALNNLAFLYRSQEKYSEAESHFKRSLAIRERRSGPNHPSVATALNNLALLCQSQGKYAEAESHFKRSLAIREQTFGPDHQSVAMVLNNLALLYRFQERYAEAEPLNQRALAICERVFGPDHQAVATVLNNLAPLYKRQGRYAEAEPLYQRALAIREQTFGRDHPSIIAVLNNFALLYQAQGKYAEAEPFYHRSLAILEKTGGLESADSATALFNLGLLLAAKGDLAGAGKFLTRAEIVAERNRAHQLAAGSERHKLAYLATTSKQTDGILSFHLRHAPDDPAARNLAATIILQRKGRALDAASENLKALRERFNREDQDLLDRLTETRAQIARFVLGGPQKMEIEQYRASIKKLEAQADEDEAAIRRKNREFRAQSLPVTLESVRSAIPPDAALVEFAIYRPLDVKTGNYDQDDQQRRYAVYVLRRDGEIQWKELGEVRTIDRAVDALRRALRDPNRGDVKRVARALDRIVFQPIRPLVGNLTRLLISPEGSLNLVPFAALVDERGRYLVERYSISYLTSGRDLLRLQVTGESNNPPLVLADPDFGRQRPVTLAQRSIVSTAEAGGPVEDSSVRSAFGKFYFQPLPYTAIEGKALQALLPDATLLMKQRATKAALNQARSPRLLHIATHGFFLEDLELTPEDGDSQPTSGEETERRLRQLERSGIRVENPLLRSGLALAGANHPDAENSGILTALEVTGLDLWGTKLVVLSACDTGVGEVKNGDGVYGLRRALVLAGSETQVMSLWPISDEATNDLMIAYHGGLKRGAGRGEALRRVQLKMLRQTRWRHPYYWASFIQSGEWANLNGHR